MRAYAIALGGIVAGLALGLSGCNNSELGCSSEDDCPAGHLCDDSTCKKLCDDDSDCVSGQYCDGEFCAEGAGSKPVIEAVVGTSDATCPQATEPDANCLGGALQVIGRNLTGATYALEEVDGSEDFALEVVASTGNSANLAPADPAAFNAYIASVSPASYTLVVTNAAGSATQDVELLQGVGCSATQNADASVTVTCSDDGPYIIPSGTDGNSCSATQNADRSITISCTDGTTGTLPAGGGGGSANLWTCDDCGGGPLTTDTALGDDRLVVRVAKVPGSVASTAVPHGELTSLCADGDGCTIEVGMTGMDLDGPAAVHFPMITPYMGMPCRFFLDPSGSGAWSVSPHCYQRYGIISLAQTIPIDGFDDVLKFQPYESGWYGVDGLGAGGGDENWPILTFWQLCIFGEAPPVPGPVGIRDWHWDTIDADDAPGFYLIAGDEAWWDLCDGASCTPDECPAEPDKCWTGATRECVMIVED